GGYLCLHPIACRCLSIGCGDPGLVRFRCPLPRRNARRRRPTCAGCPDGQRSGQLESAVSNRIPFNKPYLGEAVLSHLRDALERGHLSGDGHYTKLCHRWLEEQTGCHRALLTHSCTAALEMAALLLDLRPGDEVIM